MTNRPKNIVLCSDGTGNTAAKNRGTNVWKTYEAVDLTRHELDSSLTEQIAFYDDGVGTEDLKLLKLIGGAFGWGLSRNVRQLYMALCRVYRPGDGIFLFGFSRGAYTVRTLAGLIIQCGIIDVSDGLTDEELVGRVKTAYHNFRKHFRRKARLSSEATKATTRFREQYAVEHPKYAPGGEVPIKLIGVWDTVDAVGLPFDHLTQLLNNYIYPINFPDFKLSPQVEKACHAISLDDERHTFHPVMWDESDEKITDRIEQVWFAGVHSNVGGGYPRHGMSLVALDWMMARAEAQGLRFVESERTRYRQILNVHDKLYDSRSGAAVYYRYKPRDVAKICDDYGVEPKIHASVFNRIALATQNYAPGNLPAKFRIVSSDPEAHTPAASSGAPLEGIGSVRQDGTPLLHDVKRWVTVRRYTHYAFLLLTLVIVGFAAGNKSNAATRDPMVPPWLDSGLEKAASFVPVLGEYLYVFILRPFLVYPGYGIAVLGLLVVFYVLGWLGRRTLEKYFSTFWRRVSNAQPDSKKASS